MRQGVASSPWVGLKKSKTEIIAAYEKSFLNTDNSDEDRPVALSPFHFTEVIESLCGSKNINLAALDSVQWKTCTENFRNMKRLIDIVTKEKETDRAELLELATECETFLTSILPDYFFTESECSSHSYCHAFNEYDDGKERNMFCTECDITFKTTQSILMR